MTRSTLTETERPWLAGAIWTGLGLVVLALLHLAVAAAFIPTLRRRSLAAGTQRREA